jgi:hypothetical protein
MELKGLPKSVAYPDVDSEPFILPQTTVAKAASAGGFATFLSNVLKLKADVSSQATFTVKQITATREFLADQNANLQDPAVLKWLVQWKLSKCNAYIVTAVLDTKALEITSNNLRSGDIQLNGNNVPACNQVKAPQLTPASPDAANAQKQKPGEPASTPAQTGTLVSSPPTGTKPNSPDSKTATTNSSSPPALTIQVGGAQISLPKVANSTPSQSAAAQPKPADATPGGAVGVVANAAGAAIPSYGIYGCLGSDVQLLLAAENPVAIAVQINPITLPQNIVQNPEPAKPDGPVPSAAPVPDPFKKGIIIMGIPMERLDNVAQSNNDDLTGDSSIKLNDSTVITINNDSLNVNKNTIKNNSNLQKQLENQIKKEQKAEQNSKTKPDVI